MSNQNKTTKGLLAVSFGTLHKETCDKTIGAIEGALAEAFPDHALYRAWTSRFIIKKLRESHGIHCDTLEEALQRMAADGIKEVLVQPTHLLDGFENEKMKQVLAELADPFDSIRIGANLLDSESDIDAVSRIVLEDIYSECCCDDASALVLMGHGNRHDPASNEVYHMLQKRLADQGYHRVFVGTVEGSPNLEDVLAALQKHGSITKAFVTPLMIVAGNHALNDMAGEGEDSWVNQIKGVGISAVPIIKGLGEYKAVQQLFIDHATAAK